MSEENIKEQEFPVEETVRVLPGVSARVKAAIFDNGVIIGMMILATMCLSAIDNPPDNLKMMVFIFIFFLYDPITTSFMGGTFGHRFAGIKVKRLSDESKNVILPLTLLRFVLKATLGVISLLIIPSNENRQAIHDTVVGSIVLFEDQ